MFCSKCGKPIQDSVKFCQHCGAENSNLKQQQNVSDSVYIPQTQPKEHVAAENTNGGPQAVVNPGPGVPPEEGIPKKPKKNIALIIIIICLAIAAIMSVVITVATKDEGNIEATYEGDSANFDYDDDDGEYDFDYDSDDYSDYDTDYEDSNDGAEVDFDLSQYESHGELSDGLMWVEMTTSSYDSDPKTEFVYVDAEGYIMSEWFDSSDWVKADFSNGLLVLQENYETRSNGVLVSKAPSELRYVIYDTDFNCVRAIFASVITDANKNGDIFAISTDEDDEERLYKISKDGVVEFEASERELAFASVENLERIEIDSGYYVVDFRDINNNPMFYAVFHPDGSLAINPEEATGYMVYSIDVISDDKIDIMFKGKDDVYYDATIDFDGEFLTEPVEHS